jgi:hypothetical protein
MTAVRKELRRRRRPIGLAAMLVALTAVLVFAIGATTASLPGSAFEIDGAPTGANLRVDVAGNLDWANVAEQRQADTPPGQNDNAFGQGAKEDTPVPTVVFGGIPPQKSDLTHFGVYLETNATGQRFLNVFWRRVQSPSGTTNMDFEFNQSSLISGNGVTHVRTAGDVLIQYDLVQGGTNPQLFLSRWVTTGAGSLCEQNNATPCWGTRVDLSAAGDAIGSINLQEIPAAESDGLGLTSIRTFGEAQIDFDALTGGGGRCVAFGSAFLKSRSSDSFNAELKDFIAPVATNINQCGKVIIRKQTDPDGATQLFDYTKSFNTDPVIPNTFQLADDGVFENANVLFGNGYTVTEDALPQGWSFDHLDCTASTADVEFVIDPATRKVTFDIDNAADILDCTYFNDSLGTIIVKKITDDGQGAFDFTTATLPGGNFTLTTTGPGEAGSDSNTYADIPTGTYDVAETVPVGWNLVSSACSDGSDPSSIGLDVGETVTCTFHNARERGNIIVRKITDDGQGTFHYTSTTLDPNAFDLTTTGPGEAGADSRPFNGILASSLVGPYDVAEDVPAGWTLVSSACDDGSPVSAIDLQDGETIVCTFHNARQLGAIDITKMRKHAAAGPGDHPHPGVTFTVEGGNLPIGGVQVVTDANGRACVNGLVLSSFVGNYTVTETLPGGYHNVGPLSQGVAVTDEATGCGDEPHPDADVRFDNMPLTNIVITVDSQVDGGTASVIDCDGTISNTDPNGDGGQTHNDLEPGTYTCTVVVDP